ncbi:hypothetical protein HK101_003128, partial [Irineochytrium annulatum]
MQPTNAVDLASSPSPAPPASLSTPIIAAIGVTILTLLVLLAAVFYLLYRLRRRDRKTPPPKSGDDGPTAKDLGPPGHAYIPSHPNLAAGGLSGAPPWPHDAPAPAYFPNPAAAAVPEIITTPPLALTYSLAQQPGGQQVHPHRLSAGYSPSVGSAREVAATTYLGYDDYGKRVDDSGKGFDR